jgi:hypothetical protein
VSKSWYPKINVWSQKLTVQKGSVSYDPPVCILFVILYSVRYVIDGAALEIIFIIFLCIEKISLRDALTLDHDTYE